MTKRPSPAHGRGLLVPIAGLAGVAAASALMLPRLMGNDADGGAAASTSAAPPEAPPPAEPHVEADAAPPASASTSARPAPPWVRVDPRSAETCGPGMILVDGIYCPYVGHRCTEFANEERDVCSHYAPEVLCEGALVRKRFCIDVFEYPNIEGALPVVMVDWNDARRACAVEGKRLCTVDEWNFACEGPQMWPYPYGADRDATACNIDKSHPMPDLEAFDHPRKVQQEIERIDQRAASGSMDRCASPFGVRDMTGNVDEWVDNPAGTRDEKPYRSTLKGGYWGPVRARCRPITSTHNEWFSFYQVGFRCCSDARGEAAAASAPTSDAPRRGPRRRRMVDPGAAWDNRP